jgi:hypothetical protein
MFKVGDLIVLKKDADISSHVHEVQRYFKTKPFPWKINYVGVGQICCDSVMHSVNGKEWILNNPERYFELYEADPYVAHREDLVKRGIEKETSCIVNIISKSQTFTTTIQKDMKLLCFGDFSTTK